MFGTEAVLPIPLYPIICKRQSFAAARPKKAQPYLSRYSCACHLRKALIYLQSSSPKAFLALSEVLDVVLSSARSEVLDVILSSARSETLDVVLSSARLEVLDVVLFLDCAPELLPLVIPDVLPVPVASDTFLAFVVLDVSDASDAFLTFVVFFAFLAMVNCLL